MAVNGGPVIAVQVENEYGAYGDDTAYLKHVHNALRSRGVEELLFTCDQTGSAHHLAAGSLPGVLSTGTFGGRIEESLRKLREHQPEGPLMCSEFWIGWFDHWGEEHHVRDGANAAADLDLLLAAGASVNIYMFHGGTNFGFTNGANHDQCYAPIVTSYDYDAALTESGDPGPKYHAFREVIARHAPVPDEPAPAPSPKLSGITVELDRSAPLLPWATTHSASAGRTEDPLTMEELGQRSGYVLYRSAFPEPGDGLLHFAGGVGDRAQVFVDGAPVGVLERERHDETLPLRVPRAGATLEVLVENMGGVNYGPRIGAPKGLLGPVTFNGTALHGWDIHRLPLTDLSTVPFAPAGETAHVTVPAFHLGTFDIDTPADTFLSLPGWTKGQAWVNGFHLGRYWNRGPQRTLYVPAPVLRPGANELVLLELNATTAARAHFTDTPDLGPVKP
jgi:beta-galactosidase